MSRKAVVTGKPTVREILANQGPALTPSESKIVQLLLADYPVAGLGTASSLAKRAGVSDPTVVRLINKLGFEHFSSFQASLLGEVEARLRSPLMMIDAKRAGAGGAARGYLVSVIQELQKAAEAAVDQPYDRAAELIMRTKGRILLLGGRFSRHVAGMLAGYLQQFRSDLRLIAPLTSESFDELVDVGPRDTLIVFDYRRYQTDVVEFARQAQGSRPAHRAVQRSVDVADRGDRRDRDHHFRRGGVALRLRGSRGCADGSAGGAHRGARERLGGAPHRGDREAAGAQLHHRGWRAAPAAQGVRHPPRQGRKARPLVENG